MANSQSQTRPWLRFWARMMDYLLVDIALCIILVVILDWTGHLLQWGFLVPLVPLIWMFLEPLFLRKWGTTPGKAFLRMSVVKKGGGKLSYEQAFERSLKVWIRGVGLGIPFVNIITLIVAYVKMAKNHSTSWDQDCGTVVKHEKVGTERTVLFIFLFIVGAFILSGLAPYL